MSLDLTFCATRRTEVGEFNATHNLVPMAREAGVYDMLWHPSEGQKAGDMIEPLNAAIEVMTSDPKRFEKHNPPNGWGTYEGFLQFLKSVLLCCEENPDAEVEAW